MRTIKKLLQLMLDNKIKFESGLCRLSANLHGRSIINENEWFLINKYINENRPINYDLPFYWKKGDVAPRIEWLKEHINK